MLEPNHINKIIEVFIDNKNQPLSIFSLYPRISSVCKKGMYDVAVDIQNEVKYKNHLIFYRFINYNTGNLEYRLKDDFYKNELRKIKLNRINKNTKK